MATRDLPSVVRALVARGVIPLHWHARLDEGPAAVVAPGVDLADKAEGMMLGLAIGDALGNPSESQNPRDRRRRHGWIDGYLPHRHAHGRPVGLPSDDSQLAFWTLEHLLDSDRFDPQALGTLLASRRHDIFGRGQATAEALDRLANGATWSASGSRNAGNGALMRIAAMALPHWRQPRAGLWAETLACAQLTHADELSNASCLAYIDLLFKLLPMSVSPTAGWWFDHWVDAYDAFGGAGRYAARNNHPPGFEGGINELLRAHVRPALDADLDVAVAGDIWHSGAYLLETVPSVVYILARHGHDPRAAVEQAVNNTRDNDTVAAIVGAAMGALHGLSAWPDAWIDGLLGRTGASDDGAVFRLLRAAGERWGYGVSPRLRALASRST